jgi:hypothetical protein
MAESIIRLGENLACGGAFGLTLEDVRLFEEDLLNPELDLRSKFICTWALKN